MVNLPTKREVRTPINRDLVTVGNSDYTAGPFESDFQGGRCYSEDCLTAHGRVRNSHGFFGLPRGKHPFAEENPLRDPTSSGGQRSETLVGTARN